MAETTNTTRFDGNLDLSPIRKKRFTINSDENKVLELNTSDLSLVSRLSEVYPKLEKLGNDLINITKGTSEENTLETFQSDLDIIGTNVKELDGEMRKLVDYIFNTNVCELCASDGSMCDPVNGQLRYEFIISLLMGVYEKDIVKEAEKVRKQMKKHTDKYTK